MKAIIPCAGRNTRFNYKSKALTCVDGVLVIAKIIESINPFVDEIVIVIHSSQKQIFESAIKDYNSIELMTDDSYAGDANAIYLVISQKGWNNDILVVWGDVIYFSPTFLTEFVQCVADNPHYEMYIPATYEKKPYVSLLLDSTGNPCDVFFSKEKGYRLKEGFHDMPTYIIRRSALPYIKRIMPSKECELKILNLIRVLHGLNKKVKIVEFRERKIISFNTPSELEQAVTTHLKLDIQLPYIKQQVLIGKNLFDKILDTIQHQNYDKIFIIAEKSVFLHSKKIYELIKRLEKNLYSF